MGDSDYRSAIALLNPLTGLLDSVLGDNQLVSTLPVINTFGTQSVKPISRRKNHTST
ncbi:hypothetical protein [uncultured Nostoc sp.]|uniref:hypothetical protein n=1 Tax=uncultured Nostoc sp. TaxID=340711 RepID=UPI00261F8965|nr:hypothetical protein [uncultured Nostoc sp.]